MFQNVSSHSVCDKTVRRAHDFGQTNLTHVLKIRFKTENRERKKEKQKHAKNRKRGSNSKHGPVSVCVCVSLRLCASHRVKFLFFFLSIFRVISTFISGAHTQRFRMDAFRTHHSHKVKRKKIAWKKQQQMITKLNASKKKQIKHKKKNVAAT